MAGFGGVNEERGRAGRGEGRGDLAADMAGLAEAGDDQPSLGAENEAGGLGEGLAEIGAQRDLERGNAAAFGLQRA